MKQGIRFFLILTLITFSFSALAEEKKANVTNWCTTAGEILKVKFLKEIADKDQLQVETETFIIPSNGELPKDGSLMFQSRQTDTYLVEEAKGNPEERQSVRVKVTTRGKDGADLVRSMDHRGFLHETEFANLIQQTTLGSLGGTLLESVTVPVLQGNGTVVETPLKYACKLESKVVHLTESQNPDKKADKKYLRKFEWLSIVISPEVPLGVVSYTHRMWMNDTVDKPQTHIVTKFNVKSVSRLLPFSG